MSKAAAEDPELQLKPEARAELVDRVQRDWKEREFVETIQLNIMQIVAFLNTFDQSARFKLGDSRAIQSPHPPCPPPLPPSPPDITFRRPVRHVLTVAFGATTLPRLRSRPQHE